MGLQKTLELLDVALGRRPADMVVKGTLLNVYSGELIPGTTVAIKKDTIVYTGPHRDELSGPNTLVLDAGDGVIAPGFIDGHTHLDYATPVHQLVCHSLPTGTTTIITETTDVMATLGTAGLMQLLDGLEHQPGNVFFLAPQVVLESFYEQDPCVDRENFRRIIEHPRVLGLGEVYWPLVTEGNHELLERIRMVQERGLQPQGHTSGARGARLAACAAAGISSCHEPITAGEALERLRLGLHVMIREGAIRRDLEAVTPLKDLGVDTRRLILCSDGVTPAALLAGRYLNEVVQRAIDLGWPPTAAISMVTLNVAEHFGLDHRLGGIAPGKQADLVVLPDLRQIEPRWVICQGRLVAEQGRSLVPAAPAGYPEDSDRGFQRWRFRPEDFDLNLDAEEVRVVQVGKGILTAETRRRAGEPGLNRLAVIDRKTGRPFVCLAEGFGLRSGAVALSFSWDGSHPVVVGVDGNEMAFAANRMAELGGGGVVCREGQVLAELHLPVSGTSDEESLSSTAKRLEAAESAIRSLGSSLSDPLLVLQTVTFTGLPSLRINPSGLFDVRRKTRVPLSLA